MADQIEHNIHSKQELKDLLSNHTLSFLPREGNIKLLLDHLSENEKLSWEEKLSKYFFECGCDIGAKSAIVFLLIFIVYLFVFSDIADLLHWQTIAYGFLFVILGAVMGKISGLILYKYLLKRAVNELLVKTNDVS